MRVYKGSKLLLKKTGLTKRSWRAAKALPKNVSLTWKVRGRNARGFGAWSKILRFRIMPPSSEKAITAFTVPGQTGTTVINETLHAIAVTMPLGTDVTALVPTIAISGASVSPASGVAHDFTGPVTYTVTAADASTQDYTVTVTVAGAVIGDPYQGGIIAYVDGSGQHGLIAATADQASDSGIQWATKSYWLISVPGALGTAIGTGDTNTVWIIAQNGAGATYAAGLARAYTGGGYTDWFLPSKDELNQLFLKREAIGGFDTTTRPNYWSSSQFGSGINGAWFQYFADGYQGYHSKDWPNRVRAVRAF